MDDDLFSFLVGIFVLLIVAIIFMVPIYYLGKYECSVKSQGIGQYKYQLVGGCLVKPNGEDGFIPLENYRVL